jgi:4-hydroxy-tetrahydrodipicolinate reductase
MSSIRVLVTGAAGKMGKEIIKAVIKDQQLSLVGACDVAEVGKDAGEVAGVGKIGVVIEGRLKKALADTSPEVVIDFTHAQAFRENLEVYLESLQKGISLVVGTTGLKEEEIGRLRQASEAGHAGCVVAPNFAIGAVLMMYFTRIASKFMRGVEIIEMHHPQKKDAPSGTAIKTAFSISNTGNETLSQSEELYPGARGALVNGIRVHSVRLPGLVAHQEVIFGDEGQTLTIRHDSLSRASFMPGVIMAVKEAVDKKRFFFGLEPILGLEGE